MSEIIKNLSAGQFEACIDNNELVFVDFWAQWCAPCKHFAKVYESVAMQFPNIVFAKIDIEQSPEFAESFNIRSIPHLMVFKLGIAIYSEAGSMPESTLKELVEQAVHADVTELRKQLDEEK